ncbi:kinesin-like protein KIFC3 isoform X2 [Lethenteron reissneri]|uniref:kinesin-like protein KIFC3 isoform X2 n=1 Tax=Lethenteron reissneri TaxID=7753 RepID=UPI002AB67F7B|nr:kinesin-like protein KIFC3 isoform X2 [Lethenteron reissneri]
MSEATEDIGTDAVLEEQLNGLSLCRELRQHGEAEGAREEMGDAAEEIYSPAPSAEPSFRGLAWPTLSRPQHEALAASPDGAAENGGGETLLRHAGRPVAEACGAGGQRSATDTVKLRAPLNERLSDSMDARGPCDGHGGRRRSSVVGGLDYEDGCARGDAAGRAAPTLADAWRVRQERAAAGGHAESWQEQHYRRAPGPRTQAQAVEEDMRENGEMPPVLALAHAPIVSTDSEKQIEVLRVDNERLRRRLAAREPPSPTTALPETAHQGLHLENLRLKSRVAQLEDDLKRRLERLEELEQPGVRAAQQQGQGKETGSAGQPRSPPPLLSNGKMMSLMKGMGRPRDPDPTGGGKAPHVLKAENAALQDDLRQLRGERERLHKLLHGSQRTERHLRLQLEAAEQEAALTRREFREELERLEELQERAVAETALASQAELCRAHTYVLDVQDRLTALGPALLSLASDYRSLKEETKSFPQLLEASVANVETQLARAVEEMSKRCDEMERRYQREMALRKKYHNQLVELRGNIRVLCRVRPAIEEDGEGTPAHSVVQVDPEDDGAVHVVQRGRQHSFQLDRVFPPHASQEEVFREVQDLVMSCVDGYNICIFAYGQTGSGKTYTMEGTAKAPGINQRALQHLFQEMEERQDEWRYTLSLSMLEIYNETLRDLLGSEGHGRLDIRLCPDGSGELCVPGLRQEPVSSLGDVHRLVSLGHSNRATHCTNMNEHSSRSHALILVTVSATNSITGTSTRGRLNLVDLAGSERLAKSRAEGDRLREAQNINRSLAALGDVIQALRAKQAHVPFRNSKLTYLLQDSLARESKTLMVIQVAPAARHAAETICSLHFAQRARAVELGPAARRVEPPDATMPAEVKGRLSRI